MRCHNWGAKSAEYGGMISWGMPNQHLVEGGRQNRLKREKAHADALCLWEQDICMKAGKLIFRKEVELR